MAFTTSSASFGHEVLLNSTELTFNVTKGPDVAVNAKVFFSAAFFYISSLKDENTGHNAAATIQPNPFWFWEKYHLFFEFLNYRSQFRLNFYGTWGRGGLQPKKTEKNRKKPVPNLKFAVAFGFFGFFSAFFGFFSVFFAVFRFFSVFFGFLWYFFGFFGLNFDKKFQSFKNHVNNEV